MSGRANKREIGVLGENAVCEMLQQRGAEILRRNFTVRGGEIDIIAQLGEYLLFVEVKTRRPGSLVSGTAAVDAKKQRFIIRTAEAYLLQYPCDLQPRFDVAEVEYSGSLVRHIEYIENAFYVGAY